MMYIILERLSRTWAKNGLVSQRWRYLHQMNWWNESIESKTPLYVKQKIWYEKFVDLRLGNGNHQ